MCSMHITDSAVQLRVNQLITFMDCVTSLADFNLL